MGLSRACSRNVTLATNSKLHVVSHDRLQYCCSIYAAYYVLCAEVSFEVQYMYVLKCSEVHTSL